MQLYTNAVFLVVCINIHAFFKKAMRWQYITSSKITFPTFSETLLRQVGISLIFLASFQVEITLAARPFWTNTPSYVEGNYLYVLGAVSNVPSIEEGKQQAQVHGKLELMNVAQISEVGASDLTLESRHTYIEKNPDGSVNVYHLLRIPAAKVLEAQARLQTQRRAQTLALNQANQELATLHDSVLKKQQQSKAQIASIDEMLLDIQKTHENYAAQLEAIDQQQLEIAQFETTLRGKFSSIDKKINQIEELFKQWQAKSQTQDVLLEELKEMEESLQEKEMNVQQLQRDILARVEHTSMLACQYISQGMSPEEVKKLLGKPSGEKHSYSNERYDTWSYGTAKVNFDAQGVVKSVTNCNKRDASLDDNSPP